MSTGVYKSKVLVVACVVLVVAFLMVATSRNAEALPTGIDGTWKLVASEAPDGTVEEPEAWDTTFYSFDTVSQTMTVDGYYDEHQVTHAEIPFAMQNGNELFFSDGARSLTMTWAVQGTKLVLNTVESVGTYAAGPDEPCIVGGTAVPGVAPVMPVSIELDWVPNE